MGHSSFSIDPIRNIFLDGEKVKLGELGKAARPKLAAIPEGFVLVKSDQGLPCRRVADILDELLQVWIGNIALPSKKER